MWRCSVCPLFVLTMVVGCGGGGGGGAAGGASPPPSTAERPSAVPSTNVPFSTAERPSAVPSTNVPFSVMGELTEVNPYPGGASIKDLGPAVIMNTPVQKPGMPKMGKQLVAISKVPPEKFQTDVVPLISKEIALPPDAGVLWHFEQQGIEAVVVGAKPLASFDDIATAELRDSHYESTVFAGGKVTRREGVHKVVRVTFAPAAKARIVQYARDHRPTSVVVAYAGWAASEGGAQDDGDLQFRFAWITDEASADKAANDFVATVSRRRPGR